MENNQVNDFVIKKKEFDSGLKDMFHSMKKTIVFIPVVIIVFAILTLAINKGDSSKLITFIVPLVVVILSVLIVTILLPLLSSYMKWKKSPTEITVENGTLKYKNTVIDENTIFQMKKKYERSKDGMSYLGNIVIAIAYDKHFDVLRINSSYYDDSTHLLEKHLCILNQRKFDKDIISGTLQDHDDSVSYVKNSSLFISKKYLVKKKDDKTKVAKEEFLQIEPTNKQLEVTISEQDELIYITLTSNQQQINLVFDRRKFIPQVLKDIQSLSSIGVIITYHIHTLESLL